MLDRSEIEVGSLLGEGSFSTVHEIASFALNDDLHSCDHDDDLDDDEYSSQFLLRNKLASGRTRRYAIKHLKSELLVNANQGANHKGFERAATDLVMEAKYLARFDHPNILKLRAISDMEAFYEGQHDGLFIVTDRLEETLHQRIQRWAEAKRQGKKGATVEEVLSISLQLASALHYLHERGIVFRDLKPSNIGLDSEGNVQLFDFGLCRELSQYSSSEDDNEEKEKQFFMSGSGTLRYMAPELLLGEGSNCKADVYSWSMVLYEMLACERPFPNYHTEDDYVEYVCLGGDRPTLMTEISTPYLEDLLRQTWNQDVSERLEIAQVLQVLERNQNQLSRTNRWSQLERLVNLRSDNNDNTPDWWFSSKLNPNFRAASCQESPIKSSVAARCA